MCNKTNRCRLAIVAWHKQMSGTAVSTKLSGIMKRKALAILQVAVQQT
jgi:hypothetical protein